MRQDFDQVLTSDLTSHVKTSQIAAVRPLVDCIYRLYLIFVAIGTSVRHEWVL